MNYIVVEVYMLWNVNSSTFKMIKTESCHRLAMVILSKKAN